MAKIKGWTKVIDAKNDVEWQGDDGDRVRVARTFIPAHRETPWLMGANGQLHVKMSATKKEAIYHAVVYMKKFKDISKNIFSSNDLAKIKNNTKNNFHIENNVFIAKKIKSEYLKTIEKVYCNYKKVGYLTPEDNTTFYEKMKLVLDELKDKSPSEYKFVYSRL